VERRVAADRHCLEGDDMLIQLIKYASEKSRYLIATSHTSVFILRDVCQVLLKFKRLTSFRRLSKNSYANNSVFITTDLCTEILRRRFQASASM
jgi:hypothetical protein